MVTKLLVSGGGGGSSSLVSRSIGLLFFPSVSYDLCYSILSCRHAGMVLWCKHLMITDRLLNCCTYRVASQGEFARSKPNFFFAG